MFFLPDSYADQMYFGSSQPVYYSEQTSPTSDSELGAGSTMSMSFGGGTTGNTTARSSDFSQWEDVSPTEQPINHKKYTPGDIIKMLKLWNVVF